MNFLPSLCPDRRAPAFSANFALMWQYFGSRMVTVLMMVVALTAPRAVRGGDATIRCENGRASKTVAQWIHHFAANHHKQGLASDGDERSVIVSVANRAVQSWINGDDIDRNLDVLLQVILELNRHGLQVAENVPNEILRSVEQLRKQIRSIPLIKENEWPHAACNSARKAGITAKETFLILVSTLAQLERMVVPRGERFGRAYLNKRLKIALTDPVNYHKSIYPSHPEYRGLVSALARYKSIVAMGGWDSMLLEERLFLEGWLTNPRSIDEQEITVALKEFQNAHGLVVSGQVDTATMAVLSVSAKERLRHIVVALERWRQSPSRTQTTYLRVNIPAFTIEHWRDGKLISSRRVVVGSTSTPTTRLDRKITHVQVNPPWYVPWTVQQNDLRLRAIDDPEFYARNGFRKLSGGGLMQPPRPDNWLGQVIFRWTGPGLIFIHDTPFRERFDHPVRCYSHGCVHAESAEELARTLVVDDGALAPGDFDTRLISGATHRIRLKHPIPTYIEYVTVKIDDHGRIGFLPDVYGLDAQEMFHIEAPVVARISAPADRRL